MFGLILGRLLSLPGWLKLAIAGALVLGVIQFRHTREVNRLKKEIATLTASLDHETTANAELRVGIADVSANRDKLQDAVVQQNASIDALATKNKVLEATAAAATLRALTAGRAAADALRTNTGPPATRVAPGFGAMNTWLSAQFGGR